MIKITINLYVFGLLIRVNSAMLLLSLPNLLGQELAPFSPKCGQVAKVSKGLIPQPFWIKSLTELTKSGAKLEPNINNRKNSAQVFILED